MEIRFGGHGDLFVILMPLFKAWVADAGVILWVILDLRVVGKNALALAAGVGVALVGNWAVSEFNVAERAA